MALQRSQRRLLLLVAALPLTVLLFALVYMGGMDDKPTTLIADVDHAIDYVGEALDDTLAGRPVSRPITRAYGCPIEY